MGIIPTRWWLAPEPPTIVQVIIVDWLYREVDDQAEIKMPVLACISGHRNIEVWHYLQETRDHRDMVIAESLYGKAR